MSSIYDVYRNIQNKKKTSYDNRSAAFILEGKISHTITHNGTQKKAGLVFDENEGPDEIILFTLKESSLLKGDYFIWDEVNFLVYENVRLNDEAVDYKKQKAVECNVAFDYNGQRFKGYFVSTVRTKNSPDFESREAMVPNEQPLLMLPSNSAIKNGTEFPIEGKPWKVVEYDDITNSGIVYYYLERGYEKKTTESSTTESSTNDTTTMSVSTSDADQEFTLRPMVEYEFDTEDGVFSSTPRVEVLNRTMTKVRFKIPFGISHVEIITQKDGKENPVPYEVVM